MLVFLIPGRDFVAVFLLALLRYHKAQIELLHNSNIIYATAAIEGCASVNGS